MSCNHALPKYKCYMQYNPWPWDSYDLKDCDFHDGVIEGKNMNDDDQQIAIPLTSIAYMKRIK